MDQHGTILIYIQVAVVRDGQGQVHVEEQAQNGLRLWASNFESVIVTAPDVQGPIPEGWAPWTPQPNVRLEPIPALYRPDRFLAGLPAQARRFSRLIDQADYLCFAIGGLVGDWGSVASWVAHAKGRGYAVWTDRVESDVIRQQIRKGPWKKRLKARLYHRPAAAMERLVIRRADLGLFHGAATFKAFSPYCRNPILAHDIHLGPEERIDNNDLTYKKETAQRGPLRIVYAGRQHWSKGWQDWLQALARLREASHTFEAVWLGGGEDACGMRAAVDRAGLSAEVALPGFVSDRQQVQQSLRDAHILLFCHKTLESPRVLIEALMQGTPILGYGDAYSEDLVSGHGGGLLVPQGDIAALSAALGRLDGDRAALQSLIEAAAQDGLGFDDVSVFAHRSHAIRNFVRRRCPSATVGP